MQARISCGEYRFLKILWELEPIASTELISVCRKRLEWKKSTTYTVIRRLIIKNILTNNKSMISSCVSQAEAQSIIIDQFMQTYFDGSPDILKDAMIQWSQTGGKTI